MTTDQKIRLMLQKQNNLEGEALSTYTWIVKNSAVLALRGQIELIPRSHAAKGLMKVVMSLEPNRRLDYVDDVALMIAQEQPKIKGDDSPRSIV